MSGGVLALAACVLTFGNWAVYWPRIKAMNVPLRPIGHQSIMVVGILVAVAAFARGPGVLGGVGAVLAILAGGMMLFFTLMSAMPANVPAVKVGEPILDFTAQDADGNDFTLSSLSGSPILLKFFRGHW